ncbi:MAG TPA: hypothetical protein PLF81_09930 [Candidatus Anammoximicrobium sp.]|nr:hypothetical protein [Candidatus Anammoximicrobium sp.]
MVSLVPVFEEILYVGVAKTVCGRLDNADDVEWLLVWLNSSCGDQVDFVWDDSLRDLEFVTGPNEIRLAWYSYQVLDSDACRQRNAVPIDGRWVGLN